MNYTNEIEIVPKNKQDMPWAKKLQQISLHFLEQSARCCFGIHETRPVRVVGFWYIFRAEQCVYCKDVSIPNEFVLKYGHKKLMKAFVFKVKSQ